LWRQLPTQALNTVNFDILLFIDVLFPLTLTIIMFILALFAKDNEVQDDELNEMLKDENLYEMFLAFCKKEYSVENLYCWMDIQKFKALEVNDRIMKSLNNEKKKN